MDQFEFLNRKVVLKKLIYENVQELFEWAKDEGWNPGLNDASIAFNSFPDDFIGYFMDNEMIAAGSIVNYGGAFGFMGLFIVKKEYRFNGLGNLLWQERKSLLISKLKSGASIGMDGVQSMQAFYAKGGFNKLFIDERHSLIAEKFSYANDVQRYNSKHLDQLIEFDTAAFGFKRKTFLLNWLNNATAKSFVFFEEDILKGYAVIRQTVEGHKIGPLFAEGKGIANELLKACLTEVEGQNVSIDIPSINASAKELVKEFNSEIIFECARMYYPTVPKCSFHAVYGITSLEFG
jgi:hypothetical protein